MPGTLFIRNLTAQHFTLNLVEDFGLPKSAISASAPEGIVGNLTSNITSLLQYAVPGNSATFKKKPALVELGNDAKAQKRHDVHLKLEPCSTVQTSIPIRDAHGDGQNILRLSFQCERGLEYRVDVPAPTSDSQTLKPLDPDPGGREYTATYISSSAVLALFENTDLSRWMKAIPDHLPLSALSIPGTHNSPTYYSALPSVRCHVASPKIQLENGIRFLDVRVQLDSADDPSSDALQLVHGAFPISFTGPKQARAVFEDIEQFLNQNPSETVILCLKREGRGGGTDAHLADRLENHYIDAQRWYTKSAIPTLGEVRGKIVLMRRFHLSNDFNSKRWGIDATNWADNTPNHRGGHIQLQDFYEVTDTLNIDKKVQLVCDHLERAAASSFFTPYSAVQAQGPLYVNFLSASNFWRPGCWPDKIAHKVNPAVLAFLCEKHNVGYGSTGIVVCDWVGKNENWDLVRAIVGMNSRLLEKQ